MDTEDFKRRLGDTLQVRRRARGLTQEGLAEAVDSSTEWISQVERGIGMPSLELLLRLAAALECELVELIEAATDPAVASVRYQELMTEAKALGGRDLAVLIAAAREMAS